jgi:hypothetical protein
LFAGDAAQAFQDAAEDGGLDRGRAARGRLGFECACDFIFERGIEGKDFQLAVFLKERLDQGAAQRLADGFDERHDVAVCGGGVDQGFEDGGEIADGDLFAQKLLEDFFCFAEAEDARYEFFN